MKILLINGSPHQSGTTAEALKVVADALQSAGADHTLLWLGSSAQDCIACGGCEKTGRCAFDDAANRVIEAMTTCDAMLVGTPVYFAHPSGQVQSVLNRAFYAAGGAFAHKPGAAFAVARRAGTTASVDVLNKYFTIAQMPVVSSRYWNVIHGMVPQEIYQDEEGLQILRTLARNTVWLAGCIAAGAAAGICPPAPEPSRARTNFVR